VTSRTRPGRASRPRFQPPVDTITRISPSWRWLTTSGTPSWAISTARADRPNDAARSVAGPLPWRQFARAADEPTMLPSCGLRLARGSRR
jgi:hypothetical protein